MSFRPRSSRTLSSKTYSVISGYSLCVHKKCHCDKCYKEKIWLPQKQIHKQPACLAPKVGKKNVKMFLAVPTQHNLPANKESLLQKLVMIISQTVTSNIQLDYGANKEQQRESTGNSKVIYNWLSSDWQTGSNWRSDDMGDYGSQ